MQTVYYRMRASKDGKGNWREDLGAGWRFLSVPKGKGRKPDWLAVAESRAVDGGRGFQFRFKNAAGTIQWSDQYSSLAEAEKAAADRADFRENGAVRRPAGFDENSDGQTTVRMAVDTFLRGHRNKRPKTIFQYENALNHLVENLPRTVRYIRQLSTKKALDDYLQKLEGSYSPKTIETRMGVIFSLLKDNRAETGIDEPSKLVGKSMPKVESKRPKAYNREEIGKLFAAMTPDEYLRYRFFLVTGCREQEVQYATWDDLDLNRGTYHVTGEGKADIKFVPKSHEERTVHLTRELVDLLKNHHKGAASSRWVFVNEGGRPEGHFLRKFKAIAKRAGLNCGRCQTSIRYGHDNRRREITVTCATRPVCERHYLHRLRKTAATFWLHGGIDIMRIKTMLGHKSLAVTQIYVSDEMAGDEQAKMDRVFGA